MRLIFLNPQTRRQRGATRCHGPADHPAICQTLSQGHDPGADILRAPRPIGLSAVRLVVNALL
jgi:hypothetical protein